MALVDSAKQWITLHCQNIWAIDQNVTVTLRKGVEVCRFQWSVFAQLSGLPNYPGRTPFSESARL